MLRNAECSYTLNTYNVQSQLTFNRKLKIVLSFTLAHNIWK